MSESEKPRDPRAPGAGAFPNAPDERELDSALAAAANLAAGLAAEVRESNPPIPRTSAKDERLALDQELAELERLAKKTAEDLGAEPSSPKRKKKRSPAAVPDFMSELTGPAPEVAPRGADPPHATPDAADTVVGEALADLPPEETQKERPIDPASLSSRGAAGASSSKPTTAAPSAGQGVELVGRVPVPHAAPPNEPPEAGGTKATLVTAAARGVVGNIAKPSGKPEAARSAEKQQEVAEAPAEASTWSKVLYPAAERVVGVLEIMDRPLAWLGQPLKQVLGWFAIATMLTSIIVAVVAMLT